MANKYIQRKNFKTHIINKSLKDNLIEIFKEIKTFDRL